MSCFHLLCTSHSSPEFLFLPGSHAYSLLPSYDYSALYETNLYNVQKDYPTTELHILFCQVLYTVMYYLSKKSSVLISHRVRIWYSNTQIYLWWYQTSLSSHLNSFLFTRQHPVYYEERCRHTHDLTTMSKAMIQCVSENSCRKCLSLFSELANLILFGPEIPLHTSRGKARSICNLVL